jgi:hypothetical protein
MDLQIKPFQNWFGIYRDSYLVRELHKYELKHLRSLKLHPSLDIIPQNILHSFLKS